MSTQKYDIDWTQAVLNDRFQRTIRHPEYQEFCITYSEYFDDTGWEKDLSYNHDVVTEFQRIKDRFGLQTIIHFDHGSKYNDFLSYPIFVHPTAVECVYHRSELNDVLISSPIHPDKRLHLKIDINPGIPEKQIIDEIREHIRSARGVVDHVEQRNQIRSNLECYRAYDLKRQGNTLMAIALSLGLRNRSSADKKIRQACELIGVPYPPPPIDDEEYARKNQWDAIHKGVSCREKLFDPNEIDTLQINSSDKPTIEELVEDRILIDHLKKFCISCPHDNSQCRQKMLEAYGTFDFPQGLACPELRNEILR